MATRAGVANVRRVYRRSFVGVFDDLMFAVAVGAQRRLRDAIGKRLAVNAGAVLLHHFAVAHTAGIRYSHAERLRFGRLHLMGAPVAQGAIRGAVVTGLAGQPVNAFIVVPRLIGMAVDALRFGDVRRVGILLVGVVTGIAGEVFVSALRQLSLIHI